jgi:hypothetical protein
MSLLCSGGSSLGAKGLPVLNKLAQTGQTCAEPGKAPSVFFPDFFIKPAGTAV